MSLTVTLNYGFLLLSRLLNVATSIHFALRVAFRKGEIVAPNRQNGAAGTVCEDRMSSSEVPVKVQIPSTPLEDS